jgi:hypothetical protein
LVTHYHYRPEGEAAATLHNFGRAGNVDNALV